MSKTALELKHTKAPNNPGLSAKAWKNFHQKLAYYNLKYKEQIQENRMKGEEKVG